MYIYKVLKQVISSFVEQEEANKHLAVDQRESRAFDYKEKVGRHFYIYSINSNIFDANFPIFI